MMDFDKQIDAAIAAGEMREDAKGNLSLTDKGIRNAIIEECARVVETYNKWCGEEMIDELAAAIRALKGKP